MILFAPIFGDTGDFCRAAGPMGPQLHAPRHQLTAILTGSHGLEMRHSPRLHRQLKVVPSAAYKLSVQTEFVSTLTFNLTLGCYILRAKPNRDLSKFLQLIDPER
jgi:hypothetical protein